MAPRRCCMYRKRDVESRNKPVRVLGFLGALLLVVAAMALLGVRSGDRSALQKYQAGLRAQGEKLTFSELTRGRQTNAVDSHALITNATAKLNNARLAPGLLELRKYVGPGQVSVTWKQGSPTWSQSAGPRSRGTWEEFAAQMQAAQGTLQEIREALKHPAADAGRKLVITAYQQRKQEKLTHPLLEQELRIARFPFVQARILARHLRGDIPDYVPFVPR